MNKNFEDFRVVALLTARNEELYLEKTLAHLIEQGIEICYIDNSSEDRSLEIAKKFFGKGIFRIEILPFDGCFDLTKILLFEEQLSREINADWFMHHDADEIRESPFPNETLREAIFKADQAGFNAINFDEFVFVPTSNSESFEGKDFIKEMKYYYYFLNKPNHRLNCWKKQKMADLISGAGHTIRFSGQKIFKTNFILRHYVLLSRQQAVQKYVLRIFSEKDLKKGWNAKRKNITENSIILPEKDLLCQYQDDRSWKTDRPFHHHLFIKESSYEK